jgi:hypothetical protein
MKTLKCDQSSHHKMVEYYHQKVQTNQSEKKNIFTMKNNLMNLKLDPQNIELKETIKI